MKAEYAFLLVSLLIMAGAVSAVTYIYSNQVEVTVQDFTVSLTPDSQTLMKGMNATFQARVLAAGSPQQGITVNLQNVELNVTVASAVTDSMGYANFVVLMDTAGTHHYIAQAEIPDF